MSDVVIIGGGPAGLTLGCYLAREGVSTLIVEGAHHPRPHVGESLMPATVRVLREIGFHPVMEAGHFPRSGGVVYHNGGEPLAISYAEFPQEGVDQDHTYHVDRAKFDMLLMKHTEAQGCQILQGAMVHDVLFNEAGGACGVRLDIGTRQVDLAAKVVVDAGGRSTLLGRQLEIRREHPVRHRFALHAWFTNVDRGRPETSSYTHVHLLPNVHGWAWRAAIDDSITSIGLVADLVSYRDSGLDAEGFFMQTMAESPSLESVARQARRLNDLKGEVNYSYHLERVCGDGWLAVGDAAQFIDPIFSSGVSVAMHSARVAAERVRVALESGDARRETFLPYEQRLLWGAAIWDDFVELFYRYPQALLEMVASREHRLPILKVLQGDLDRNAAQTIEVLRAKVLVGEAGSN